VLRREVMGMSFEAWLAIAAFGVLMTLWLVLPSRFIHRTRNAAERSPKETPARNLQEIRDQEETIPGPPRDLALNGAAPWAGIVEVRLARNPSFSLHDPAGQPRYYFLVRPEGIPGAEEARIPVYWRPHPTPGDLLLREVYEAEVAGRWVRAGNLQALQSLLVQAVRELFGIRLPAFWLVPPKGRWIPVSADAGALVATIPAGPRIVDRSLGGLTEKFRHYLALTNGASVDRLTVAKLSPLDLRLHLPVAVFEGQGVWIPVFHLGSHLSAEDSLEQVWKCEGDLGALLPLWRQVCEELHQKGRLPRADALAILGLSGHAWEALQPTLRPTEYALTGRQSAPFGEGEKALPVWRWEEVYLCRGETEGACLYASFDPWELCARLGMDLRRRTEASRAPSSFLGSTSLIGEGRQMGDRMASSVLGQPVGSASSRTA